MKPATGMEMQDCCWAVPAAAAIWVFLVEIVSSSSGLLYVFFMDKFNVSHEEAAWPIVSYVIVANLSGLLVSILQQWVKPHSLAVFGSILASAGLVACSLAPNITWMTAALAGLCGFFRDTVGGSYDHFYWLLAAMNLSAATLTCGLCIYNRLRHKAWNVLP
ncbi:monocarboxylate transporter 7-like isoform X2 [Haemaphysalis longicornis]